MNSVRTDRRGLGRLPRVGLSACAVLLGLVAQLMAVGHVLFEHVGHAHGGHAHAHAHHDGHDHDHHHGHHHGHEPVPLPDGIVATAPADAHGCGDDCPVQDVPLTLTPTALAALHASPAPQVTRPIVPRDHLAAHRAEPLTALAPKTSPPIA